MAKKKRIAFKSPSMEVAQVLMTAEQKKREEQYRLDDDARTIRNYLDLKNDGGRHSKAIAHMRRQDDGLDELEGRKGRKSSRKPSRGGRR